MKKMLIMFMMCSGCLMEDLPLPPVAPDAEMPTDEPDATTPVEEPDATVPVMPDADTPDAAMTTPEFDAALSPDAAVPESPDSGVTPVPDASVPVTPDASVPDASPPVVPDASMPDASPPVVPDATPPPSPDATCPACDSDTDCSDGYSWTSDSCSGGACVYVLTDCGGMQIRPSESAVTCMFWAGFGSTEPAPALGSFVPESLATGPEGGLWKAAPVSACSVICYSSGGNRVDLDLQTEWSGATGTLFHAVYGGVTKGTFDGLNMEW